MTNKSKRGVLALLLCGSIALGATGCDQLRKEPETETETETESETETEVQTESETETETETESETETETEAPSAFTTNTTAAQEQSSLIDYDTVRVMYALEAVNVRTEPNQEAEIFTSFEAGDSVPVIGETMNWYRVDLSDYDFDSPGYVYKEFIGDSADGVTLVASSSSSANEENTNGGEDASSAGEESYYSGEEENDGSGNAENDNYGSYDSYEGNDSGSDAGGVYNDYENAGSNEENTGYEENAPAAASDTDYIDAEYNVESYADAFPVTATAGANMRSEPSQDGEIVSTIASDTEVTVLGYTDRWYKVSYNGMIGYVNKNLFTAE